MSFGQLFDIWLVHIPFWLPNTSKFHTAQKMKFSIKDFFSKCNVLTASDQ